MSNKIRRCEPNLTYHTYSRCADKLTLMKSDRMKELMLKVIVIAQSKYDFELMSYAIMDNHFHFLIRTVEGGATISSIMQFIKAQYSLKFNKIMGRSGPFWNERYGDTIIEEQDFPTEAFNEINCYIVNNPVKANYVIKPEKYRYSSINFYIKEDYMAPVKLTFHEYYLLLGSTFRERAERFLEMGKNQLIRVFNFS
jgi:REP element-mobilizing transposase RayT